MAYEAVNTALLPLIPKTAKRILDLGCGSGGLGQQIKYNLNCIVVGVTYSASEALLAAKQIDQVFFRDLNSFNPAEFGKFDCIICSHILEHLYEPRNLLEELHENLEKGSILIVALPNILHWKQRLEFLQGRFRYTEGGVMDKTHFRFFDCKTAQELLELSGYKILEFEAEGVFPLPRIRKFLPTPLKTGIDRKAVQKFPGLFGVQFVFSCCSGRVQ